MVAVLVLVPPYINCPFTLSLLSCLHPGGIGMLIIDGKSLQLEGAKGTLAIHEDDEITLKLAMLYEGECEGLGPTAAARKFGFTKQRYYQLLQAYSDKGAIALQSRRRGPKTNYRRTDEVVRQIIRHRFLDPEASAEVIAQKLQQGKLEISIRSVERVIEVYGLQKKTLQVSPRRRIR
jgi:transposase